MDASAQIAPALLAWYDRNARSLPWRTPPHAPSSASPHSPPPDPYRVWLAEVMLQQTTTTAVVPYFAEFLRRWPTVEALAAADDAEVMAAWAGLGYYARARNLLACARVVAARGGAFPETEGELRGLPGLGAYSAAAIAAIAFGQRAVVIDANVERVVARLFAIAEPLPAARKPIRAAAEAITPTARCGDFAQAMMDIGATICAPRAPRCLLCPLAAMCQGKAHGDPARYPLRLPKVARPHRTGHAFWIERDGAVWLVRRPAGGMLGGMRAMPDDGWSARGDGAGGCEVKGPWRAAGVIRHGFTHFTLDLHVSVHAGVDIPASGDGEWWPLARLDDAGLPTLFAKAARLVLAARENEG